jgi:uncharacterized protein (UPF0276 family)
MTTTVGIGLRSQHLNQLLEDPIYPVFLEVHAENYLRPSPSLEKVLRLRNDFELSVHAVGLSLGSVDGVDEAHLDQVARLVDRLQPTLISEHLSWSCFGGRYFNDLLPLPYTEESLDIVARNVGRLQDRLGRQVAIENPSAYLGFRHSTLTEAEFLDELVRRSGCGLLLDINNVAVTAHNLGLDPAEWLNELPGEAITQFHLAGHTRNVLDDGSTILIDDHGSRVCGSVWSLFDEVLQRFGPRPTLVEWDTDIPALAVLLDEAAHAGRALANADLANADLGNVALAA